MSATILVVTPPLERPTAQLFQKQPMIAAAPARIADLAKAARLDLRPSMIADPKNAPSPNSFIELESGLEANVNPVSQQPLVAQQIVLDPQFLFLELGQDGVVGVGAVLFAVDLRFERCVLVFERIGMNLVHRYHSLREWMRQSGTKP